MRRRGGQPLVLPVPVPESPAVGQPAVGHPAVGQPAVGQPAVGQPAVVPMVVVALVLSLLSPSSPQDGTTARPALSATASRMLVRFLFMVVAIRKRDFARDPWTHLPGGWVKV